MEFLRSFLKRHLAGKPVVVSTRMAGRLFSPAASYIYLISLLVLPGGIRYLFALRASSDKTAWSPPEKYMISVYAHKIFFVWTNCPHSLSPFPLIIDTSCVQNWSVHPRLLFKMKGTYMLWTRGQQKCSPYITNSKLGHQHTRVPLAAAISPFMSLQWPTQSMTDLNDLCNAVDHIPE